MIPVNHGRGECGNQASKGNIHTYIQVHEWQSHIRYTYKAHTSLTKFPTLQYLEHSDRYMYSQSMQQNSILLPGLPHVLAHEHLLTTERTTWSSTYIADCHPTHTYMSCYLCAVLAICARDSCEVLHTSVPLLSTYVLRNSRASSHREHSSFSGRPCLMRVWRVHSGRNILLIIQAHKRELVNSQNRLTFSFYCYPYAIPNPFPCPSPPSYIPQQLYHCIPGQEEGRQCLAPAYVR